MFVFLITENGSSLATQWRLIRSAHQTLYLRMAAEFGLSEFLSGEKCPFPGRLQKASGRILCSEREQYCAMMEW